MKSRNVLRGAKSQIGQEEIQPVLTHTLALAKIEPRDDIFDRGEKNGMTTPCCAFHVFDRIQST